MRITLHTPTTAVPATVRFVVEFKHDDSDTWKPCGFFTSGHDADLFLRACNKEELGEYSYRTSPFGE